MNTLSVPSRSLVLVRAQRRSESRLGLSFVPIRQCWSARPPCVEISSTAIYLPDYLASQSPEAVNLLVALLTTADLPGPISYATAQSLPSPSFRYIFSYSLMTMPSETSSQFRMECPAGCSSTEYAGCTGHKGIPAHGWTRDRLREHLKRHHDPTSRVFKTGNPTLSASALKELWKGSRKLEDVELWNKAHCHFWSHGPGVCSAFVPTDKTVQAAYHILNDSHPALLCDLSAEAAKYRIKTVLACLGTCDNLAANLTSFFPIEVEAYPIDVAFGGVPPYGSESPSFSTLSLPLAIPSSCFRDESL
ncbi:hypothetical protein SCAR479_12600 [Seiridium cardinale]|uniref:Uncharacterized protein n=1 Tax=Seiridium cardinale TaxID=138064 RepID=A0ABR2XAQ6_9PEZI